MNILNFDVYLPIKKFPELYKLKNNKIAKKIKKIFKDGYNINYPNKKNIKKNIKQQQILESIDSIKYNFDNTIKKLIGNKIGSAKKGQIAENILEKTFEEKYFDIIYEKKNTVAHSGDAWVTLPNGKKIMIESKNYSSVVNKDEIIKLEFDMKFNNIKWGIMISYNSRIQGCKDLDLHVFFHNDESYIIIMISNFVEDNYKLDLGLQILNKLIVIFDKLSLNNIYKNNFEKSIYELNDIIRQNYMVRDSFLLLEKNIISLLSSHYNVIREYQFLIDKKINDIAFTTKNIDNKIMLLSKYKKYKVFSILSRFIDICESKKWFLNEGNILYNDKIIGIYKIQTTKIIATIKNKYLIIETKENIEDIKKL